MQSFSIYLQVQKDNLFRNSHFAIFIQMKVTFMQPLQYFSQDFDILLPADTTNKNVILLIQTFFYPFKIISIFAGNILGVHLTP